MRLERAVAVQVAELGVESVNPLAWPARLVAAFWTGLPGLTYGAAFGAGS